MNPTPEELLILEAKNLVGVREVGGQNRGVEIFQQAVGGLPLLDALARTGPGEPWCAGFVFYCVDLVDATMKKQDPTRRASWLYRSASVVTLWQRSPLQARLIIPTPGCLMLWQNQKNPQSGHVGIVVERVTREGTVQTVEGNTATGKGVNREGDGVYQLTRRLVPAPSSELQVLGYLRVWGPPGGQSPRRVV